jgi:hypothetical protein
VYPVSHEVATVVEVQTVEFVEQFTQSGVMKLYPAIHAVATDAEAVQALAPVALH